MKKSAILAAAAIALTACGSMPQQNSMLEEARANYQILQNDVRTRETAAIELKQATDALNVANQAWQQGEDTATVDHLAYIAKQRVAIAQETVSRKAAEQMVENASRERDQMRLNQRTQEAMQAKQDAQAARNETLELQRQLQDLQAKQTARGMVVTLGDVLFSTGSSELKGGGMRNLQKLADMMKSDPKLKLSVEGFTDSTGSADRNQTLSEERAQAVTNALRGLGVDSSRIETRGYGPQYPVASNKTAAGRQLNRRVEVVISGPNGVIPPR